MSNEPLEQVLEDAIYYSLDAEQGAPHSGVDMQIVVGEFIKYLGHRGYEIVHVPEGQRLSLRYDRDAEIARLNAAEQEQGY